MHKTVSSTNIVPQLQSFGIQTNATRLGGPADIVHSSPTNMGHQQYTNTGSC